MRVLRALLELPEGFQASAREVARRGGMSHPTASKVLASLASQGLVLPTRRPRGDGYVLNREHVLVQGLESIFELERNLRSMLMSFLRERLASVPVTEAFLFGSVARGETEVGSDVDLAVICMAEDQQAVESELERVSDDVWERFGGQLNAVVATAPLKLLARQGRPGYRLWRRISEEGIAIATGGRGG